MRPFAAFGLAVGFVLGLARPPVHGAAPAKPAVQRAGQCGGLISPTLSAASIRMCDTLTVTVRVEPQCLRGSAHVVVVEPMHAFDLDWMKRASLSAVDAMEKFAAQGTPAKVGVILYRTLPRTILPLSNVPEDGSQVRSTIRQPGPAGTVGCVHFEAATREAVNMLEDARPKDLTAQRAPLEMVIFFGGTKEHWWDPCRQRLLDAARNVHAAKIALVAGCIGIPPSDSTWCMVMPELVKSRRYYIRSPEMRVEQLIEEDFADYLASGAATGLELQQTIPTGLAYVDGSASEAPASVTRSGGETDLRWEWPEVGASQAHTITYRVRPLSEGDWTIGGTLGVADGQKLPRQVPMTGQSIRVSGRCEAPTATPSPIPTATPAPTSTPTATPRPTASATPSRPTSPSPAPTDTATPEPRPIYFPLILREECRSQHQRADVALLIDTSSSMTGQKLRDAQDAALAFVDAMDLAPGRDQVTVVRFDSEAEVRQTLTHDRPAIEQVIRGLGVRSGTYIDRGLAAALAELQSARRIKANIPVVVLLTDGRQSGDAQAALDVARLVRDAGIALYAIGLGEEVDAGILTAIAGTPSRYRFAPESADLRAIYADVAKDIRCPDEQLWPRRPAAYGRRRLPL